MMDCITARLTVFFEDPFWVGVFERQTAGKLTACKVTFGTSPSDGEVYAYFLRNWRTLRFSPPIDGQIVRYVRNPKRMQRLAGREITQGIGTKAQQALQLQREQNKRERLERSRQQKEAEAERRFALKQQKRREKHKGH